MQLKALDPNKLNVAGENHPETEQRIAEGEHKEKSFTFDKTNSYNYWTEQDFAVSVLDPATNEFVDRKGDPVRLRIEHIARYMEDAQPLVKFREIDWLPFLTRMTGRVRNWHSGCEFLIDKAEKQGQATAGLRVARDDAEALLDCMDQLKDEAEAKKARKDAATGMERHRHRVVATFAQRRQFRRLRTSALNSTRRHVLGGQGFRTTQVISNDRSLAMHEAAVLGHHNGRKGVWKIGDSHVSDIKAHVDDAAINYQLLTKDEFNLEYNWWIVGRKTRPAPDMD